MTQTSTTRTRAATQSATKRTTSEAPDPSDDLVVPKKKKPKPAADEARSNERQYWKVSIMFDGGARGNPGIAGAGALVTISSSATTKPISFHEMKKIRVRHYLGSHSTNNEGKQNKCACCTFGEAVSKCFSRALCIDSKPNIVVWSRDWKQRYKK